MPTCCHASSSNPVNRSSTRSWPAGARASSTPKAPRPRGARPHRVRGPEAAHRADDDGRTRHRAGARPTRVAPSGNRRRRGRGGRHVPGTALRNDGSHRGRHPDRRRGVETGATPRDVRSRRASTYREAAPRARRVSSTPTSSSTTLRPSTTLRRDRSARRGTGSAACPTPHRGPRRFSSDESVSASRSSGACSRRSTTLLFDPQEEPA